MSNQISEKKRILVAMSGGVDSSVAAALLKEQGHEVIGVTMQVWDYSKDSCNVEEGNGTCCSSIDVDDARAVADHLDIPFYVMNCEEEFQEKVIDNFVSTYMKGETPIPCVNCNTFLKFDHLIKKMRDLNCDAIATGHYAQIKTLDSGEKVIVTSSDDWKDQTYFLFTLKPELLNKIVFPVGDWKKPELREYAQKKGLPVFNKKDSTGICFIGKKGYQNFIEENVNQSELKPGEIRHIETSEVLAKHDGIHRFTVGQRKGLGVATGDPIYVVKIDPETATVWLGPEKYLYHDQLKVSGLNLFKELQVGDRVRAKIRFAHKGAEASITGKTEEGIELTFTEPQRAITKGQAAVLYNGNELLGGGWII